MLRRFVSGALVSTVLQALPAHAEPPAPPTDPEPTAAARTTEPTSAEEAERLFHDAEIRYAEGDLPAALRSMKEAYARSARHELLFNLGELERELGQCRAARHDYAEYVARVPGGRRHDEATRKESELRVQCPDSAPALAPAQPARPPQPGYWTPATIAGWATIGASVAMASGATYFAIQASQDERYLEDRMHPGNEFTHADKQIEHDGERSAAWARGFFVGASVLVATGITLLVVQPGSAKPASTVTMAFDAQGATAAWRGHF